MLLTLHQEEGSAAQHEGPYYISETLEDPGAELAHPAPVPRPPSGSASAESSSLRSAHWGISTDLEIEYLLLNSKSLFDLFVCLLEQGLSVAQTSLELIM